MISAGTFKNHTSYASVQKYRIIVENNLVSLTKYENKNCLWLNSCFKVIYNSNVMIITAEKT